MNKELELKILELAREKMKTGIFLCICISNAAADLGLAYLGPEAEKLRLEVMEVLDGAINVEHYLNLPDYVSGSKKVHPDALIMRHHILDGMIARRKR